MPEGRVIPGCMFGVGGGPIPLSIEADRADILGI